MPVAALSLLGGGGGGGGGGGASFCKVISDRHGTVIGVGIIISVWKV